MGTIGNWFRGVRGKMMILIIVPSLILSGLSFYSYKEIAVLTAAVEKADLFSLPLASYAGDMDIAINGSIRWMWTAYLAEAKSIEFNKAMAKLKTELATFNNALEQYQKLPHSDKMKELFKPVEDDIVVFEKGMETVQDLLAKQTTEGNNEARAFFIADVRGAANKIGETLATMSKVRRDLAKEDALEAAETSKETVTLLLIVSGLAILFLVIVGALITRRLVGSLTMVTDKLNEGASVVSSASEQLTAASQALSSSATEAASALEETVASTEELSSMVKQNADNAKEAAVLSQTSRKSAEDGEAEIRGLIEAMGEISTSSKKIEEIINVIDDIAFQTNLLALNAAVEAARAGEQGKGFAVVAEAVRNLAQRSATAAKDITTLIKDSVHRIERGSKTADQSGEVLKAIVASVKKVADLNNEISAASREQAKGLSQITKAMNELDRSTQGNASSSEEVAAASEEMNSQSMSLQEVVESLVQLVNSGANQPQQQQQQQYVQKSPSRPHRPVAARLQQRTGSAHVIPIRSSQASEAESMIPFEEDPSVTAKISGTNGF